MQSAVPFWYHAIEDSACILLHYTGMMFDDLTTYDDSSIRSCFTLMGAVLRNKLALISGNQQDVPVQV